MMIRQAETSDLPTIAKMKIAMFVESGIDNLAPNAIDLIINDYEQLYDSFQAAHFIVCQENRIVACAGAFIKSDMPYCYFNPEFYGFVGDVYTKPEYRRHGFAKELISQSIGWLKKQGVTTIRLLASDKYSSIYQAFGFVSSDEMILKM